MKYKTTFLFIILFSVVFNFQAIAQDGWKRIKDSQGIIVYKRDSKNSDNKEIKLITTVKSTLAGLVAVLRDISSYPEWIYATEKAYVIKKPSESECYYYLQTDSPWPAKDRDIVIKSTIKQLSPAGIIVAKSVCVSGYVAKKENIIRITHYNVLWTFKISLINIGLGYS